LPTVFDPPAIGVTYIDLLDIGKGFVDPLSCGILVI